MSIPFQKPINGRRLTVDCRRLTADYRSAHIGAPMELRHLRYFIAVAEELSFTRAATALHVAQSAVSAQIQLLEQDVGVPLLERSSRRVELTAAGRLFLLGARKAI